MVLDRRAGVLTTPVVNRKQVGVDGSLVRSRTNTPFAIMPSMIARTRVPPSISTKFVVLVQYVRPARSHAA